jgi:hypothetical protein
MQHATPQYSHLDTSTYQTKDDLMPEGHIDLQEDLQARMVPSSGDVERAAAAIESNNSEFAITPMAFVGKPGYGVWDADVIVETTTAVYACSNDESFDAARNEACVTAARQLGERPGTVGYAVHRVVNGEMSAAMFEDILPPLKHLKLDGTKVTS